VAWGTLVAAVFIRGILQPYYVIQVTKIGVWSYFFPIVSITLSIFMIMFCANWLMVTFQPIHSWLHFCLRGVGVTLPAAIFGLYIATEFQERKMVWDFVFAKRKLFRSP
jgi:hypothetical protein